MPVCVTTYAVDDGCGDTNAEEWDSVFGVAAAAGVALEGELDEPVDELGV
jgi:hypothetical protein